MSWSFAILNGRLAEVYFELSKDKVFISAHCYVKPEQFKTKREQKWIRGDTAKYRFSYRNKMYKDMKSGKQIPSKPFDIDVGEVKKGRAYTVGELKKKLSLS